MGGFLNMVLSPLESIFKPLISIFKTVLVLIQLFIELLKMLPKFFYMFNYITDPGKIISDAFYGFTTGIKMIIKTTIDTLMGKSIGLINPHVKDDSSNNKQKGYTEDCLTPSLLEILILLLCPPLAIFIRKGLKGFFTIVITAVLTYFYYLPGLVYASLYVL